MYQTGLERIILLPGSEERYRDVTCRAHTLMSVLSGYELSRCEGYHYQYLVGVAGYVRVNLGIFHNVVVWDSDNTPTIPTVSFVATRMRLSKHPRLRYHVGWGPSYNCCSATVKLKMPVGSVVSWLLLSHLRSVSGASGSRKNTHQGAGPRRPYETLRAGTPSGHQHHQHHHPATHVATILRVMGVCI